MKKIKCQLEYLKEEKPAVEFSSIQGAIKDIEMRLYHLPYSHVYRALKRLKGEFFFGRDSSTNPSSWKHKISKLED